MAVVEEHTWAPPLAGEAKVPQKDDKGKYSEEMGVPLDKMGYSDFIKDGRLPDVDEVIRETYKEASEMLGRKFEYPTK
jgi:ribonuclease Z